MTATSSEPLVMHRTILPPSLASASCCGRFVVNTEEASTMRDGDSGQEQLAVLRGGRVLELFDPVRKDTLCRQLLPGNALFLGSMRHTTTDDVSAAPDLLCIVYDCAVFSVLLYNSQMHRFLVENSVAFTPTDYSCPTMRCCISEDHRKVFVAGHTFDSPFHVHVFSACSLGQLKAGGAEESGRTEIQSAVVKLPVANVEKDAWYVVSICEKAVLYGRRGFLGGRCSKFLAPIVENFDATTASVLLTECDYRLEFLALPPLSGAILSVEKERLPVIAYGADIVCLVSFEQQTDSSSVVIHECHIRRSIQLPQPNSRTIAQQQLLLASSLLRKRNRWSWIGEFNDRKVQLLTRFAQKWCRTCLSGHFVLDTLHSGSFLCIVDASTGDLFRVGLLDAIGSSVPTSSSILTVMYLDTVPSLVGWSQKDIAKRLLLPMWTFSQDAWNAACPPSNVENGDEIVSPGSLDQQTSSFDEVASDLGTTSVSSVLTLLHPNVLYAGSAFGDVHGDLLLSFTGIGSEGDQEFSSVSVGAPGEFHRHNYFENMSLMFEFPGVRGAISCLSASRETRENSGGDGMELNGKISVGIGAISCTSANDLSMWVRRGVCPSLMSQYRYVPPPPAPAVTSSQSGGAPAAAPDVVVAPATVAVSSPNLSGQAASSSMADSGPTEQPPTEAPSQVPEESSSALGPSAATPTASPSPVPPPPVASTAPVPLFVPPSHRGRIVSMSCPSGDTVLVGMAESASTLPLKVGSAALGGSATSASGELSIAPQSAGVSVHNPPVSSFVVDECTVCCVRFPLLSMVVQIHHNGMELLVDDPPFGSSGVFRLLNRWSTPAHRRVLHACGWPLLSVVACDIGDGHVVFLKVHSSEEGHASFEEFHKLSIGVDVSQLLSIDYDDLLIRPATEAFAPAKGTWGLLLMTTEDGTCRFYTLDPSAPSSGKSSRVSELEYRGSDSSGEEKKDGRKSSSQQHSTLLKMPLAGDRPEHTQLRCMCAVDIVTAAKSPTMVFRLCCIVGRVDGIALTLEVVLNPQRCSVTLTPPRASELKDSDSHPWTVLTLSSSHQSHFSEHGRVCIETLPLFHRSELRVDIPYRACLVVHSRPGLPSCGSLLRWWWPADTSDPVLDLRPMQLQNSIANFVAFRRRSDKALMLCAAATAFAGSSGDTRPSGHLFLLYQLPDPESNLSPRPWILFDDYSSDATRMAGLVADAATLHVEGAGDLLSVFENPGASLFPLPTLSTAGGQSVSASSGSGARKGTTAASMLSTSVSTVDPNAARSDFAIAVRPESSPVMRIVDRDLRLVLTHRGDWSQSERIVSVASFAQDGISELIVSSYDSSSEISYLRVVVVSRMDVGQPVLHDHSGAATQGGLPHHVHLQARQTERLVVRMQVGTLPVDHLTTIKCERMLLASYGSDLLLFTTRRHHSSLLLVSRSEMVVPSPISSLSAVSANSYTTVVVGTEGRGLFVLAFHPELNAYVACVSRGPASLQPIRSVPFCASLHYENLFLLADGAGAVRLSRWTKKSASATALTPVASATALTPVASACLSAAKATGLATLATRGDSENSGPLDVLIGFSDGSIRVCSAVLRNSLPWMDAQIAIVQRLYGSTGARCMLSSQSKTCEPMNMVDLDWFEAAAKLMSRSEMQQLGEEQHWKEMFEFARPL